MLKLHTFSRLDKDKNNLISRTTFIAQAIC